MRMPPHTTGYLHTVLDAIGTSDDKTVLSHRRTSASGGTILSPAPLGWVQIYYLSRRCMLVLIAYNTVVRHTSIKPQTLQLYDVHLVTLLYANSASHDMFTTGRKP